MIWSKLILYFSIFIVLLVLVGVIYFVIKRITRKDDFENRDN